MLGEIELGKVAKGDIIQLQRKGFFKCDVPYAPPSAHSSREQPLVLFNVPDGHATSPTNQTVAGTPTKATTTNAKAKQTGKEEVSLLVKGYLYII